MALQIKKKNLGSNQVDGSKILLAQGQAVRAFDSNGVEKDLIEFGAASEVLVNGSEVAYKTEVEDLQSQITNVLSNVDPTALDSLTEIVTAFEAADANLNGAITSLATSLGDEINAEESARIAGDSTLQANINAEPAARDAEDSALRAELESEIENRMFGDNQLQTAIDLADGLIYENKQEIDALELEVQALSGDVLVNSERIDFEVGRAQEQEAAIRSEFAAGDTAALDSAEDYTDSQVSAEAAAREAADLLKVSKEGDEMSGPLTFVHEELQMSSEMRSNEVSFDFKDMEGLKRYHARLGSNGLEFSEANLDATGSDLAPEVPAMPSSDFFVTTKKYVDDQDQAKLVEAKAYADQKISEIPSVDLSGYYNKTETDEAISTLQSNLQVEINNIQANLDTEIEDREDAVSNLQSQIDNALSNIDGAALDSLTEVVAAFQAADSDLNGAITSLASSASSALSAEESARIAGDQQLQSNLDSAVSSVTVAVNSLQSQITYENGRALAAEAALQSEIDAEETRAMGIESGLQSQITQEVSDRQSAISSETSARQSAEAALQSEIDAEENRAIAAEASLQSGLDGVDQRVDVIESMSLYKKYSLYNDSAAVYSNGNAGVEDPSAITRDGWYFQNSNASDLIGWYFYDRITAQSPSIEKKDFTAFAVMTFDAVGANGERPIMGVYTYPTGTNDAFPGFFHSRWSYQMLSLIHI
jgi:hypothetical protein